MTPDDPATPAESDAEPLAETPPDESAARTAPTADTHGDASSSYEAVVAHPAGESTVARYAKTVREYGFDGVVVRSVDAEYDPDAVRDEYGVDVVSAAEVDASDPATASGAVGNYRPDYEVVVVRGGTPELNRFAVEQDRVDVLADPMAGSGDVNHVIARAAKENGVRIEVNLGPVLRTAGGERVRAVSALRKLREIVEYYDAPFVVSCRPASHLQVRAPRELAALGESIGFSAEAIRAGLAEWGTIAARNRRRRSESFIGPGVRRGRYEADDH